MTRKQQGTTEAPLSLFISYAHEDELLRQQLEKHLSLLRRQGLIAGWHDRQILAGDEWGREIDEHLSTASIILLLISPDFLASDYCYDIEMHHALERHQQHEARVIPIILRPCDWRTSPFAHLQCLPRDGKAVTNSGNQDEAFLNIAQGLRRVIEQQEMSTRLLSDVERQNRTRLIKRVQAIWIEGVLEHSLHQSVLIALDLQEQPDALANPWGQDVQETNLPPRLLPAETSIVQIYEDAEGELLILGEPGAGKTTLLLELARDLLKRAKEDETYPIPVIFNLSSWAKKQSALEDWMVEELWTKYQVPQTLGREWLSKERILPLLDGFDEVREDVRANSVDAINAYHTKYMLTPLVACSRRREYFALKKRVVLRRAVFVQPLTMQQADVYLASAGDQLEPVRKALHENRALRELITTPLMLSVLTIAYQEQPIENLLGKSSVEVQQQQIFDTYVQRMFLRRGIKGHYKSEQTISWLVWLARCLSQHNQAEFHLEDLQPSWLPSFKGTLLYHSIVILFFTIGGGILFWLVAIFGSSSLFFGLITIFVVVFTGIPFDDANHWLLAGLLVGLVGGVFTQVKTRRIVFVEATTWSWKHMWRGLTNHSFYLVMGVAFAIVLLTLLVLGSPVLDPYTAMGLLGSLSVFLAIFIGHAVLSGLLSGLSRKNIDMHAHIVPNQGLRDSVRTSARVGLIVGTVFGLGFVLYHLALLSLLGVGNGELLLFFLFTGLLTGVYVGAISSLIKGGTACVQHIALRCSLWMLKCIPWNYSHFLDYAVERILLYKVGGGYIFIHRLLLDYFVALGTSSLKEAKHS